MTTVTRSVSVAILTDGVLASLPPPNGEGYVFMSVGWFVCVSVTNITGKCMNGFPWNFQDRSSKMQGTIWKILWVLCLTPSVQARSYIEVYSSMMQVCYIFFFFQGNPCLLATLRENGWTDFHEIFRKYCTWDKEQRTTFLCRGD